jgi:hypothetical protein
MASNPEFPAVLNPALRQHLTDAQTASAAAVFANAMTLGFVMTFIAPPLADDP